MRTPARRTMSAPEIELLAEILRGAPRLEGAACRDQPRLFDPRGDGEDAEVAAARHQQAVGLCRRCPSLDACREWVASLPRSHRPAGIIAAQNITDSRSKTA